MQTDGARLIRHKLKYPLVQLIYGVERPPFTAHVVVGFLTIYAVWCSPLQAGAVRCTVYHLEQIPRNRPAGMNFRGAISGARDK